MEKKRGFDTKHILDIGIVIIMRTTRRFFSGTLISTALVGSSGCLFVSDRGMGNVDDITITNRLKEDIFVTLELIRSADNEVLLKRELKIPAGEIVSYDNPITQNGTHTITIDVKDGPTDSYRWNVRGEGPEDKDAYGLYIVIDEQGIQFSQIGS